MQIIGRVYEQKQLEKFLSSNSAEFAAVYGRRRVGKTYLIKQFFSKKDCLFFRSSGIYKGALKLQLEKFKKEIESAFYKNKKGLQLAHFSNWHDAFEALKDAIELNTGKKKIVLFLDEIPWMATPKSGLLEALDYYWNRYLSENKKVKLIICGSAASWIIENVLHNKGGLHNRVTLRLPIESLSLADTKAYLQYRNVHYNHDQILMLYMCLGGIPFYLNFVENGLSAIQNINNACFHKKGTLYDEFEVLFASLFKNHKIHEELITIIASKREGICRSEIEERIQLKGGRLTQRLEELEEAGFINGFVPWKKSRGTYYKIIDEYTLFYLSWIAPKAQNRISKNINDQYWEVISSSASWKAWSGYAFEAICFKHIRQIKNTLHIPDGSEVASWRYIPDKKDKENENVGMQIDLIFDRPDNVVNLCEIKYSKAPFVIDKKYAQRLLLREAQYYKITKTKKQLFHSMIVSSGLKKTMYSEEIISSIIELKDLFSET